MTTPPQTTLILSNIPSSFTLGIDLQFFNSNDLLKGIKLIPQGIHVFHYQPDQNSIRTGFYFEAKDHEVIICYWDSKEEKLLVGNEEIGELNVTKELTYLPEYYPFMIAYPDHESSLNTWKLITSNLTMSQINYVLPKGNYIDSTLTSTQENNYLLQTLQESAKIRSTTTNTSKDPILNSIIDQSSEEIKYSIIDIKRSFRPNSTPQEKTKDGLDKSWYLQNLLATEYNTPASTLLGEIQLSYLNFVIFANHSSMKQWLNLQHIITNCHDIILQKHHLFQSILGLLILQYENLPEEYFTEFIETRFIKRCIDEIEWSCKDLNLHGLVKLIWKWKFTLTEKFASFNDEDDSVGEFGEFEEEDDEDGPVIVDDF